MGIENMGRIIFMIFLFAVVAHVSEPVYAGTKTIPYKIIKKDKSAGKASYDIQIDLVNDNGGQRLPNKDELKAISEQIKAKEKNTQNVFVLFYLPGMRLNEGAFAQAHHTPNLSVKIMDFMLFGTKYEKFVKN